ncbi:MAG: hypothetical protein LBS55_03910 [Prevotellaceae bacterium]|jgi:hypothetical protein|nr:hypothetical protein [Prevotellaceae bacterium]
MSWLYNEPKLKWLLLLTATTLFFAWFQQTYFATDILYYNTYGDTLSIETIDLLIENAKKYSLWGYLAIPAIILLRILFTTLCLYLGSFFRNISNNFKVCFNIALKADAVFLLALLFNVVYHTLAGFDNLIELTTNPLYLLYYVDGESIPKYLLYPVGLVSFFELLYWAFLAGLVKYRYEYTASGSLEFVAASYGTGTLLVILVVVFLVI